MATVPSRTLVDETHVVVMRGTRLAHDPARRCRRESVAFEDVRLAEVFVAVEPWRMA